MNVASSCSHVSSRAFGSAVASAFAILSRMTRMPAPSTPALGFACCTARSESGTSSVSMPHNIAHQPSGSGVPWSIASSHACQYGQSSRDF